MNETASDGRITTKKQDRLFLIGIDRPKKLNGFTPEMFAQLSAAYGAYEDDPDAWCAVVYAEGDNFTAGLQLTEFDVAAGNLIPNGGMDPFDLRDPRRTKPVVMAVKGYCYTLGIELMLAADIVIAEEGTRFRQHEVGRGLMAFGGATLRFAERAGWGNAMLYLLTGDEFGPETAFRLNFVQAVAPKGQVENEAIAIAERIAAQAPMAVAATRRNALTCILEGPDEAVVQFEVEMGKISNSSDLQEGINSFSERREGRFTGK